MKQYPNQVDLTFVAMDAFSAYKTESFDGIEYLLKIKRVSVLY